MRSYHAAFALRGVCLKNVTDILRRNYYQAHFVSFETQEKSRSHTHLNRAM